MTEAEWLACAEPGPMLAWLGERIGGRKVRLFACACCRQIDHLITVPACREAVAMAERFADGLVAAGPCRAAYEAAQHARPLFLDGNGPATWVAIDNLDAADAAEIARMVAVATAKVVTASSYSSARAAGATGAPPAAQAAAWASYDEARQSAEAEVYREQADLLREIVGNPWRPPEPVGELPGTVVQLADAMAAGEDVAFALHDALLEAGRADLAEHFRGGRHPRGCWALDAILGRG